MADSVAEHIAALGDQDWGVREDAAAALGPLADPRSVHAIRKLSENYPEKSTSGLPWYFAQSSLL